MRYGSNGRRSVARNERRRAVGAPQDAVVRLSTNDDFRISSIFVRRYNGSLDDLRGLVVGRISFDRSSSVGSRGLGIDGERSAPMLLGPRRPPVEIPSHDFSRVTDEA